MGVQVAFYQVVFSERFCGHRTEGVFGRHGDRALLLAKFIPGIGITIPPAKRYGILFRLNFNDTFSQRHPAAFRPRQAVL